jgi:hypothetical protein
MLRQLAELERRERETSERLARFRGNMCDEDFATLVSEVVRVRDRAEGRSLTYPWDRLSLNPPTEPVLDPIIQEWLEAQLQGAP